MYYLFLDIFISTYKKMEQSFEEVKLPLKMKYISLENQITYKTRKELFCTNFN